jgi:hypothetical protein
MVLLVRLLGGALFGAVPVLGSRTNCTYSFKKLPKLRAHACHVSVAANSNKRKHMLDINFVQEQRKGVEADWVITHRRRVILSR